MFDKLFNLFRKRVNDIKNNGCTDRVMSDNIKKWWDIYCNSPPWLKENTKPLPIVAISTAYLAQLVSNELKYEVEDEFINGQL